MSAKFIFVLIIILFIFIYLNFLESALTQLLRIRHLLNKHFIEICIVTISILFILLYWGYLSHAFIATICIYWLNVLLIFFFDLFNILFYCFLLNFIWWWILTARWILYFGISTRVRLGLLNYNNSVIAHNV